MKDFIKMIEEAERTEEDFVIEAVEYSKEVMELRAELSACEDAHERGFETF